MVQSLFLVGYYFEVGLVVIYATMCLPPRRVYYYPHGSTPLKILVVLLSFSHYFEQQFVSFCLASIHCQLDRTGLRVAFYSTMYLFFSFLARSLVDVYVLEFSLLIYILISFSHYFEQQFVSFCLASIHFQLDRTGLALIAMRQGTFTPLVIWDCILSAVSKISKLFLR